MAKAPSNAGCGGLIGLVIAAAAAIFLWPIALGAVIVFGIYKLTESRPDNERKMYLAGLVALALVAVLGQGFWVVHLMSGSKKDATEVSSDSGDADTAADYSTDYTSTTEEYGTDFTPTTEYIPPTTEYIPPTTEYIPPTTLPPVTSPPDTEPATPLAEIPAPAPEEPPAGSSYYANCAAARSAGAAPLYRGDPGYSSRLDRDGDGVACE